MKLNKQLFERIKFVRDNHHLNVKDPFLVALTAASLGYHDVAVWVLNNKKTYKRLLANNFKVKEVNK